MDYKDIRAVNWSSLKHMRTSPKEYLYQLTAARTDSTHFRIGRLVHTLILEPEVFSGRHPIFTGAVRRGKTWDQFLKDHPEVDPENVAIESELERARGCADAVRFSTLASRYFCDGITEQAFTWTDEDTGLACKGRCDSINGHLVELKTAAEVGPRKFAHTVASLGYHGQLAFYYDGLRAAGLMAKDAPDPVLIAVQSEQPHDLIVYTVPAMTLEAGRCLYKRLLMLLDDCMKTDYWPGACEAQRELILPAWAFAELESDDQPITIGGVPVEV